MFGSIRHIFSDFTADQGCPDPDLEDTIHHLSGSIVPSRCQEAHVVATQDTEEHFQLQK